MKHLLRLIICNLIGTGFLILPVFGGQSTPTSDTTGVSLSYLALTPPQSFKMAEVAPAITLNQINWAFNGYEPGQCVWLIKELRPDIPDNWGDAYMWSREAKAIGWPTGTTPRLNAVGTEGDHVVLVVSLTPFMIREMNYDLVPFHERTRLADPTQFTYIY